MEKLFMKGDVGYNVSAASPGCPYFLLLSFLLFKSASLGLPTFPTLALEIISHAMCFARRTEGGHEELPVGFFVDAPLSTWPLKILYLVLLALTHSQLYYIFPSLGSIRYYQPAALLL